MSITEQHADYAQAIAKQLHRVRIRVDVDIRNEKMENGTVTLRNHAGENLGTSSLADTLLILREGLPNQNNAFPNI